jgi:excisionase family DNA binding protein
MILNDVMSVAEAAALWGLAPVTVRRAIREGRLKATRSASTWLIAYADMQAAYGEPKGEKQSTD